MTTLRQQSLNGAKWMTVSMVITTAVSIIRLAILTRFLEKSDFGLIAILTFITGLTERFSDMGFSTVVMSKRDLNERQFSSLFWIQMSVYSVLYLIIICFTKPIASFYDESLLCILIPLSLLDLLFGGVGKLYETVLQKNFQFRLIAFRNIISSILSLLIAVILATMGCGVYTLVISTLFASFFLNVWNFILGQKEIKLIWFCRFKENLPLVKIGLYQTGTQIVDYFCSQLDVLIIGKLLGMDALGLYNLAKELIHKTLILINNIVNRVLSPVLSKLQNDVESLRGTYCGVIKYLTCITFPVIMILAALSVQVIDVMYGSKYGEAGELTAILAIWCALCAVGNPVGNLVVSTGRTDLSFKYVWVRALVCAPCIYVCSLYSIIVVAWGLVVSSIITGVAVWAIEINPIIHIKFTDYLKSFSLQGIICLAIGISGYLYFSTNPWAIPTSLIQLLVYGVIIVVVFLSAIYLFMKNDAIEMLKLVKQFVCQ